MAFNLFPPLLIAVTLLWSQSALADLPPASGSFPREGGAWFSRPAFAPNL